MRMFHGQCGARGRSFIFALMLGAVAMPSTAKLWAEEIKHSFFVAGAMTGLVSEDLEVVWDSGRGGARDGCVLPNGNVLICWTDVINEYDKDRKIIWSYKIDPKNQEFGTVQRLPNGPTMLTELGRVPRLLEVDGSGKILVEVPLKPETDNFHMQTRMARKLANGNYLVPHLLAFAVKEYTPAGEVVKTFYTNRDPSLGKGDNWPFTAIRLANGNTLIDLTHGDKVIEVDPEGAIVWKVTNDDFDNKPLSDPCGGQRLPNGNTVIASYGAKGDDQIKMFEITREKKIVWSQTKFKAHHFQILTTNGKPIEGTPLR